jgi:hypothetical protein
MDFKLSSPKRFQPSHLMNTEFLSRNSYVASAENQKIHAKFQD